MKRMQALLCALALAGCAGPGALTTRDAEYAALESVAAIETSATQLLGAGRITAAQAQDVATQSAALRQAIASASASPPGSPAWGAVNATLAALQAYLASLPNKVTP